MKPSESLQPGDQLSDTKRKMRALIKVFGTIIALNVIVISIVVYLTSGVRGSGILLTETIQLEQFDRLTLEGVGTARIIMGGESSLEITTDDNMRPLLDIHVEDGNLVIRNKEEIQPSVLLLLIHTPILHAIDLAGDASIEVADFSGETFSISIRGHGRAHVAGLVNRLAVKITGNGSVQAQELIGKEATIDIQGDGDVTVHTTDRLAVNCEGSGKVRYSGSPVVEGDCSGNVKSI
jgi:hypothetical protein